LEQINNLFAGKKNFIADMKACWIFWEFEQLSSAIVGRGIPMQKHVQIAGF